VAGSSWDEAVREKILEPLGMDRTSTSINEFDRYMNVSTPHVWKDGRLVAIPWLNVDNTGPAGCINSSAADMAKWIQVHLDEGRYEGNEIWGAEVQRQMFSPHAVLPGRMTGQPATHTNFGLYGLGWMMHDYRGRKIVHHGGATDGMGAFVGLVPEERLGVVVLHNTTQSPLLTLLFYGIVDSYLGVPAGEWTKLGPPRRPARPRGETPESSAGRTASLPLDAYAGVYNHPIYERVEVVYDHGDLALKFDLYPRATLEHTDLDTFRMRFEDNMSSMWDMVFGRESYVSFHVDADGGVDQLSMSIFGGFTRVEGATTIGSVTE
jgi:CubicO group peptidase (beta-lactamase class C family)